MWQVSDRFLATIRGPHKTVCVADILDGGNPVEGYAGLPVVGGQVTRDRFARVYASGTVTVASPDLAPLTPQSPLTPTGYEARIYIGVEYSDGTQELVPVLTGPIQDARVDDDLFTTLEIVDRSQWLIDAIRSIDATFAAGYGFVNAIEDMVDAAFGTTLTFQIDLDSLEFEASPRLIYEQGDDYWREMTDIVQSVGGWLRFNGSGDLIGSPEPDLSETDPVWIVNEENDTEPGVLISSVYTWSRTPVFNGVMAIGRNVEFDVLYTSIKVDNDPASPSYWHGRFMHKLRLVESTEITSTASAGKYAQGQLLLSKGLARSLDFTAAPNYALEPADVVLIQREAMGLDLPVVVDSLTIGLGPEEPMTGSVRARQETEVEDG